ncbi:MAG: YncE family protein [Bacteroidetes bacterium]|nr:YncE family protein [Bacteroidota bacterium]
MKLRYRLLFVAMAAIAFNPNCFAQKTNYHIVNTFHVKGDGKWDYIAVCPTTNNIYTSHATEVNVIDKTTGESVGTISNTTGVHGIAFVPAFTKGFTSNGKINTLTVFDLKTNTIRGQINVGENPDAIMFDPFSKKVFVCNGKSKDLSVVDPATDQVIKTVPLGGKPETAVSDEAGHLYINLEDKNELVTLDTKSFSIQSRHAVGKGDEPSGLAIDRKTKRLFIGCGNKLMIVMNAESGKVITELPIGDKCDGVGFDMSLKQAYSSNGDGTLTIIKEKTADTYEVLENVVTKKGAKTLAIDEKTHLVYLSTADFSGTGPDGRPGVVPGTFQVLVVGK